MRRLNTTILGVGLLFVGFLFLGAPAARGGADDLDQVLREWVAQNIYFESDRWLLIRKRPVRAYIRTDDPEIATEARRAITNFADAFGLGVEFTTTDANLFVVTANGIADGDKPSRTLLASLGLTDAGIDFIVRTARWSGGCGTYSSRDKLGHVSATIVAADKSLTPKKLRSCVVTGIIFSFGLRVRGQEILDYSNDYIQFLLLARSLAACEKELSGKESELRPSVHDVYLECVLSGLKAKFSR